MQDLDVVLLSLEELEAVRLVDLEGLEQEAAALRMGISRRALWEDLQNARRKSWRPWSKGKPSRIKGGDYTVEGPRGYNCRGCNAVWEIPFTTSEPSRCPRCKLHVDEHDQLDDLPS